RKQEKAEELLIELEVKHPNFEWPLIPLSALALKDGNVSRSHKLVAAALKRNPNFVKAWCAKGRLAIAEWRLPELDSCVEKANDLDGADQGTVALANMQNFINQNGLR